VEWDEKGVDGVDVVVGVEVVVVGVVEEEESSSNIFSRSRETPRRRWERW